MQAENYTYASEEIATGHTGYQHEQEKDDQGASGIGPTEHVAHLLNSIDDCIDHPQHQLDDLLHFEHLLQQAGQFLSYSEVLAMDLKLPVFHLLRFGLLRLL